MYNIPKEIDGTPVCAIENSRTIFRGKEWITLIPEADNDDCRIWEFCPKSGILIQTGFNA